MTSKRSKNYTLALLLFGISCFFSLELKAQAMPNQKVCILTGPNYWAGRTYTYYDLYNKNGTGTSEIINGKKIWYYNPNGTQTVNYDPAPVDPNYEFVPYAGNEGCWVNAYVGEYGTWVCKPSVCDVDDVVYLLILGVLLFLTYLHFNRKANLKLLV